MERIKLTFMDCNYAVHKDCGVVVATAKFKIFGEVLTIKGKSMCPPSMFDVNIGKKIARARAERSAYIRARQEIKIIKKHIERQLNIVNSSLYFFHACITHHTNYINESYLC